MTTATHPHFTALIYGAPFGRIPAIPTRLPPMFMAWAQDDAVALNAIVHFRDALTASGQKPEIHVFSRGGHGFGMKKQGTTRIIGWSRTTTGSSRSPSPARASKREKATSSRCRS
jgi:acetyl esterase/lipase